MATSLAQINSPDFSREKLDLIRRTICVGATDDELELFLHACKRTGLDPLMKQIYAVKRWNKQAGREVMAVQTGIDGYRLIADRTGQLAGISDPLFDNESGQYPGKASVTVKKIIGSHVAEFTATARWSEYVQVGKEGVTAMWKRMPYLMLGKCAEALALRKGFPAELAGVYTTEEMAQEDNEKQRNEVYAEVERQKHPSAAVVIESEAAKHSIPPELDWSYNATTGVLLCRIMEARLTKKKKGDGELVTLKINQHIMNKSNLIYYFHVTHRDALLAAVGKIVKMSVTASGDFLQVSDVMEIAGEPVARPIEDYETRARLLASNMDFAEEDLTTLYEKYAGKSWEKAVEMLEKRAAELEAVTA